MADVQKYSLATSLDCHWLKLPLAVMRDVGPATQTFAGFEQITHTETFTRMSEIARRACVPLKTARNHLDMLEQHGWLLNKGRGHTKRGSPRRTNTIALTPKAKLLFPKHDAEKAPETDSQSKPDMIDSRYGFLPWWACCSFQKRKRLSWAAKAVLSIVMARLAALKAASRDVQGKTGEEWFAERLRDRFRFSSVDLEELTGLSRTSVRAAKRELARADIIHWYSGIPDSGGMGSHWLVPNPAFRVVVSPASVGHVYLNFEVMSDAKLAMAEMEAFF